MSFTSHHDHSKWTIAATRKKDNIKNNKVADNWVCVGDINRAVSTTKQNVKEYDDL